jgi:hypothetical protein
MNQQFRYGRQVDVLVSQAQHIADAIRQIGVSEVTYYRWRAGVRQAERESRTLTSPDGCIRGAAFPDRQPLL